MSPLLFRIPRCSLSFSTGAGAFLLASSLLTPWANSASTPTTEYRVTSLGVLDNPGSSAVVRRVNSFGEAVGGFNNPKLHEASAAFIVSSAAGFDNITEGRDTDFSVLYGINDRGEVAGAINGEEAVSPFRSVRHKDFQLLPLLPGDHSGIAYGINEAGESVGFSSGTHGVHAAWWTRKGAVTELPGLPHYTTTKAIDINGKGDIVGYAGEGTKVAVLWPEKGGITVLRNLETYTSSQAESISDNGDVVGVATAFDPKVVRMRAVLWPAGTSTPLDLGTLPGGTASRARDVDVNGVVVGTSDSHVGNRAFIWTAETGIRDLNSLSSDRRLLLVDALSISKKGDILAVAININDLPSGDSLGVEEHELPRHIVLLTPIK